MEPLRDIAADGYPTDYLVARVRSRRAALLAAGRRGRPPGLEDVASDEAIWDGLLTEFDWLRRQMNPRLRSVFAPVFTLFGIKTLVLALRNKAAERHAAVGRLMQHELFADDLRAALVGAPDVGSAVAAVVDAFTPALGDARGLEAAYADGGLKGENLLLSVPKGYKIDFQKRQGSVLITEMVPQWENVNAWTEMVTAQIFHG